MAPDTGNGRVTLAVLGEKVDAQATREEEHYQDLKADNKDIKAGVLANAGRLREVEIEQARNQEQHKRMIWGQGLYATVAAGISTALTTLKGG